MSWDRGYLEVADSLQKEDIVSPRIVLVGQSFSGKRTIGNALLRSLDESHKYRTAGGASPHALPTVSSGPGLGHASIAPTSPHALSTSSSSSQQQQEPSVELELLKSLLKNGAELFVCNHREALVAALPTLRASQHAMILFVVDVVEPETVTDQLQRWAGLVRDRVSQLIATKSSANDNLRSRAVQVRDAWKQAAGLPAVKRAAALLSQNSKSALENTAPLIDVPLDGICPLPSVILFNKGDALDAVSHDTRDVPGVSMKVSDYLLQWGRKIAILSGSGFMATSAKKMAHAATARGLLLYCLLLARRGAGDLKVAEGAQGGGGGSGDTARDDHDEFDVTPSATKERIRNGMSGADGGEDIVVETLFDSLLGTTTAVAVSQYGGAGLPLIPRGADSLSYLAVTDAVPLSEVFVTFSSAAQTQAEDSSNQKDIPTYTQLVEDMRRLAEGEANKKDALLWAMFS